MGYIYLITNIINGHQYVGQTLRDDIEIRWRQHKEMHKNAIGRYLFSAYKKYGVENFKFQIICICFDEDCNKFEKEYINKFNTLAPGGYNLQSGGSNWHHHPDTIAKMKESLKGRAGILRDDDWKIKMRERMSGEKNPNYGKKMQKEQKEMIRISMKKKHANKKQKSEIFESLKTGREILKNLGKFNKKVGKYDRDGILLESFDSISEASSKTEICFSTISRVCLGKPHCKTAGGFVWKYV